MDVEVDAHFQCVSSNFLSCQTFSHTVHTDTVRHLDVRIEHASVNDLLIQISLRIADIQMILFLHDVFEYGPVTAPVERRSCCIDCIRIF